MNIIIVGGGTAGWLAALFISKVHPSHKVTVIESSDIGIVGAGEGSTGALTGVLRNSFCDLGCDLLDFIKETGATLKLGIKHKGWTRDTSKHYLGPIGGSDTAGDLFDSIFAYVHSTMPEYNHMSSDVGYLMEHQLSTYSKKTFLFERLAGSLHFDAVEVGKYFNRHVLKQKQVIHIDDKIINVNLDSVSGDISSLILESGKTLSGDFFIDASGFKQVLMKKLDTPWISYSKHLPVNSAMPFLIDYEEEEIPELWTTAWAQSSGWMWQIPTQHRKGCGYVFDDRFISADQAQAEIEKTLGKKIDPIRVLKFNTGRLQNAWVKNCLAIGLASAFAEPLEATSIHSTIIQIVTFVFEFLKGTKQDTVIPVNIKQYNKRTARMYDDFKDFLNVHYMGGREDSEFWKYISSGETKTDFVADIIEMSKYKLPGMNSFDSYFGSAGWELWAYVLAGTNVLLPEVSRKELDNELLYLSNIPIAKMAENQFKQASYNYQTMFKDNMQYSDFINFIRRTTK